MKIVKIVVGILLFLALSVSPLEAQKSKKSNEQVKDLAGANEKTPSRAQYFSWINNTNEGATEAQTMVNLNFFEWLNRDYGMVLDIYAFDAGVIDGKRIYGSTKSKRFFEMFPNGFDSVYIKAKSIGTRFGVWGGPDGFGDSDESAQKRIDELVELCSKYEWALYKFDAVCGPLRLEKEDKFIELMERSRQYSPDLILLNHRLGLKKSLPYATTFLWEGAETYIDVFSGNKTTAPHNRAGALSRGMVPNLQRLTEDHGVCISSCIDYWDDDLILQAFNRSLILAPEIYANPWLMSDSEFPKLARIYNLHRKYGDILVNGVVLPDSYGLYPISRGDSQTRLITLRNLDWNPKSVTLNLNKEIGLVGGKNVYVRLLHPYEEMKGVYRYGEAVDVTIEPFRALMVMVTTSSKVNDNEPYIEGAPYKVIKDVEGEPVEISILGMPGNSYEINVPKGVKELMIDGKKYKGGSSFNIAFDGEKLNLPYHRKLGELSEVNVANDAAALYEATVFAADNNAMEVRSLERSGDTKITEVKAARDAFFNQKSFKMRGLWDKYLFDGDMNSGFWATKRFGAEQRIGGGCFRLDLGRVVDVDSVVVRVGNSFALEPMLIDEGNYAYVSADLNSWKQITYRANVDMNIEVSGKMRYLKLPTQPQAIYEVEVYSDGVKIDGSEFRASNLFADSSKKKAVKMWSNTIDIVEAAKGSYLSIAINGKHGVEGAYAAIKVNGKYVGAPSRATSYQSNTWEYLNLKRDSNYTYYIPVDESMVGAKIEVFVMAYDKNNVELKPEVWISANPIPFESSH